MENCTAEPTADPTTRFPTFAPTKPSQEPKDRVWKTIDDTVTIYQSEEKIQLSEVDVVNFQKLDNDKKLQGIEMVLNRSIRTNLAKDGGGVELKGIEGNEVSIHYQGACGSCPTSTSGTLKYIQGQLREQLHPDLTVKSV